MYVIIEKFKKNLKKVTGGEGGLKIDFFKKFHVYLDRGHNNIGLCHPTAYSAYILR